MVKIMRYVLCVLFLNVVGLSAMEFSEQEQIDSCVEDVRNKIDEELLGISKNIYFRGLIGTAASWLIADSLTKEGRVEAMQKVESYIELKDKKEMILETLIAKHWYVYYVMQTLVGRKVKKFESARGCDIDTRYDYTEQEVFQRIVHNIALNTFLDKAGIKKSFYECVPQGISHDIHTIVLYGHNAEISPSSLVMSDNSKYLRSEDCNGKFIVWDMEEGVKVDLSQEQWNSIKWTPGRWVNNKQYGVIDKSDSYYAVTSKYWLKRAKGSSEIAEYFTDYIGNIPVKVNANAPAIILYQRPSIESFCGQQVYNNCKWDGDELDELLASNSCKNIKGFPGKNLKERIELRKEKLQKKLLEQ